MRVLVACEFSGTVRDAFIRLGHDAMSCDIDPTDVDGPHYHGDVRDVLNDGWDLMIAHPPCTHLAVSGSKFFAAKIADGRQQAGLDFVRLLMDVNIERIAIENPVSVISSKIRKPDQIINPWMFGHTENKKTCLWLKNLPKLTATNNVRELMEGMEKKDTDKIHYMSGKDRGKRRSVTYFGIAKAMAEQWGGNGN